MALQMTLYSSAFSSVWLILTCRKTVFHQRMYQLHPATHQASQKLWTAKPDWADALYCRTSTHARNSNNHTTHTTVNSACVRGNHCAAKYIKKWQSFHYTVNLFKWPMMLYTAKTNRQWSATDAAGLDSQTSSSGRNVSLKHFKLHPCSSLQQNIKDTLCRSHHKL